MKARQLTLGQATKLNRIKPATQLLRKNDGFYGFYDEDKEQIMSDEKWLTFWTAGAGSVLNSS